MSLSLRDMTESLWDRIDSMESFAADVAHELKNPLTSLRSAFETLSMVKRPQAASRFVRYPDPRRGPHGPADHGHFGQLAAWMPSWRGRTGRRWTSTRWQQDVVSLQRQLAERDVEIILGARRRSVSGRIFYILGAGLRLGQVLVNVITNAQTFSPAGR